MQDVTTAIARVIAMEAGATLVVETGFAYDTSDSALGLVAGALLEPLAAVGIDLLAVRREGSTLLATVDESQAEEVLCPAAFNRVVRQLSHRLLGQVWDAKFTVIPESVPAPAVAARVARVA
jgi:hypothetical protein